MEEYLESYGWHFNRKMCEWAVKRMKRKGNEPMTLQPKETIENALRMYGIDTSKFIGYDAVYVYHMAMSDFLGSSLPDERSVAMYVKDYLDDPDGYDEVAFTRFYADCIGKGEMPEWEDVL